MKILIIDKTDEYFKKQLIINNCVIIEKLDDSKEKILENFDFDGLILRSRFNIDSSFIKRAKGLKFIARYGSGIEHIDINSARKNNITCINCPEGNKDAVAEHTIGLILCLLNKINLSNNQIKQGIWNREENRGLELMHKTIGVIGYGNTGQSLCDKLKGFNCNIIVYDKYKKNYGNDFIKEVSMNEIFNNSDILSIHIPLNNETKNMINNSFLNKFKKPIFFINTSRGKIINTNDLITLLKNQKVLGACLDVLEYEENSFENINSKNDNMIFLKKSNNVLLTPHIAGLTFESKKRLSEILAKKILDFIKSIK
tara:strand:- start:6 stop:944 length:939 start_codon:yes stop_codon:yes gene_type:complete